MDGLIPQQDTASKPKNLDNNRFRGETKQGLRHGVGKFSYPMGGQEFFTYDGTWNNGVKSGQGTFSIAGLSKYEGEFDAHGEITGFGTRTWTDGRTYKGNFINGEQNGKGLWTKKCKDWAGKDTGVTVTFEGDFVDNRRQGEGTLNDGTVVYTGPFVANRYNGRGMVRACDGSFNLKGTFVNDIITGDAEVSYSKCASSRSGTAEEQISATAGDLQAKIEVAQLRCPTWKKGRPEGEGIFSCADGSYHFSGNFECGYLQENQTSSYLWTRVDRAALVATEDAAAEAKILAAGGKVGKKAPPPKKSATDEAKLTVPRGCGIGDITVRSGGKALLDAQAADALAAASDPKSKKGKDAPVEGAILPPPEPPVNMPIPCEHRRLLKLTFHNVIASGSTTSLNEPTLSAPLPLWVRKITQEEAASDVGRFPIQAVLYGDKSGLLDARARPTACEALGSPSVLSLEGGASASTVDDVTGVTAYTLSTDAALSYTVGLDQWPGAQSRTTYYMDFKLDISSVVQNCRAVAAQREAEIETQTQTEGIRVVEKTQDECISILSLGRIADEQELAGTLRLFLLVPRSVFALPPVVATEDTEDTTIEQTSGMADAYIPTTWEDCRFQLCLQTGEENLVCSTWAVGAPLNAENWQAVALDMCAAPSSSSSSSGSSNRPATAAGDCVKLVWNGSLLQRQLGGAGDGPALAWLPEPPSHSSTNIVSRPETETLEKGEVESKIELAPVTIVRHLVRSGGTGFAGRVKLLALGTASEECQGGATAATSVYEAWRQKEAKWTRFKINDWYSRAAIIAGKETALKRSKADNVTSAQELLTAAQNASLLLADKLVEAAKAIAVPEGVEVDAPSEEATAAVAAASAAAEEAATAVSLAEAALVQAQEQERIQVPATVVPDVPYDYSIEHCAYMTLVCGSGDTSHVSVPVDAPPGEYVLRFEDAVSESCVYAKVPGPTTTTSSLDLHSVGHLVRTVRPIPVYTKLAFTVFDPTDVPA